MPTTTIRWFDLARHDDGDPDPDGTDPGNPDDAGDPADEPDPDGTPDDDPAPDEPEPDKDGLGEAGKKALDRMKADRAKARQAAAAEKKRADDLARRVQEFEDAQKTELERAAAKAERLAETAAKATARAVSAEVKAAAKDQFADASDAVDVLMRDPSKYVDSDGEIDTDAIQADIEDLLERKPHWAKPAPAAPVADPEQDKPARRQPRPDPGQGSRGKPAETDFRSASKDELAAELAKFGYRQRYS